MQPEKNQRLLLTGGTTADTLRRQVNAAATVKAEPMPHATPATK